MILVLRLPLYEDDSGGLYFPSSKYYQLSIIDNPSLLSIIERIQIHMIWPIRVDHTEFFQEDIKTHSSIDKKPV
jgi:hypothetical protein